MKRQNMDIKESALAPIPRFHTPSSDAHDSITLESWDAQEFSNSGLDYYDETIFPPPSNLRAHKDIYLSNVFRSNLDSNSGGPGNFESLDNRTFERKFCGNPQESLLSLPYLPSLSESQEPDSSGVFSRHHFRLKMRRAQVTDEDIFGWINKE